MNHHKIKLLLTISGMLFGAFLCSDSAYAAFSASISRSGTVSLAEPGSSTIRPTSTGALGTGSDVVTVTTNCTYGGYKLYVSATSTGGTVLKLSDNSDSIPTSSNLVGSETTLSRDTWGVGKTASAFSGLQAYTDDIGMLTPFYTGVTSDSYTFYYGVNVSTAKTPGTYAGEVLYTVLMDEACTKYTLNFDGNNATTNNLTAMDLDFDSTINLAEISDSSKITRTGYTLSGWKDQNNNSYGITGTADINPNDLASVTLIAQWSPNTLAITYDANGGTGEASKTSETAYYDTNITMPTKNTLAKTGYSFIGWSLSSTAEEATWTAGQTDVDPADINSNLASQTNLSATIYAVWEVDVTTMQGWAGNGNCAKLSTGQSATLKDARDGKEYAVKKLPDGKCWMMQNLTIGSTVTANTGIALTKDDTNINNDDIYYLPPAGKQSTGTITQLPNVNGTPGGANFASNNVDDTHAKTMFRTASSSGGTNDSDTGYYNFYTATLGFSSYQDGKASGSSSIDICPKNWRLPHVTDAGTTVSTITTANDFTYLARQYGTSWSGTATSYYYISTNSTIKNGMYISAASPLATTTQNNYAGFSYTGNYSGTSLSRLGSLGSYWPSSVYTSDDGYHPDFDSTTISPQNHRAKYYRCAVRCVAK